MDFDFENDPLGQDEAGNDVFLKDIWPSPTEVQSIMDTSIDEEMFVKGYAGVFEGDDRWKALDTPAGDTFAWDQDSTYVRKPPYFECRPLPHRCRTLPARVSWPSSATR
jgi:aconitate hydratase